MVLFPPWGSSDIGFLPGEGLPYGIPSGGRLPYGIISGGGGGVRRGEFPCDTGVLLGGNACLGKEQIHDNA